MNHLSADEVRLVMQFLDRTSLLQLARCNRRLLSDADSDLPWRHLLNTVHVKGDKGIEDSFSGSRYQKRLCTHISWMFAESDTVIQQVLTIPRIRSVLMNQPRLQLNMTQWKEIFHHQSFQQIRSLTIRVVPTAGRVGLPVHILDVFVSLPCLERFELTVPWEQGISFAALPKLVHLRSLALIEPFVSDPFDRVSPISFPPQLQDLRMSARRGRLYDLWHAPTELSTIERLTLEFFDVGVEADTYGNTFASMVSLREIRLLYLEKVECLLHSLLVAPSLTSVYLLGRPPSIELVRDILNQPSAAPTPFHLRLEYSRAHYWEETTQSFLAFEKECERFKLTLKVHEPGEKAGRLAKPR